MKYEYGNISSKQLSMIKKSLRSSIFFLLLCVDPDTCEEHKGIDVDKSFVNLLHRIGGLNDLLSGQIELVNSMSLLQAARNEYNASTFNYSTYRKLILDAGAEIAHLEEGDLYAIS